MKYTLPELAAKILDEKDPHKKRLMSEELVNRYNCGVIGIPEEDHEVLKEKKEEKTC